MVDKVPQSYGFQQMVLGSSVTAGGSVSLNSIVARKTILLGVESFNIKSILDITNTKGAFIVPSELKSLSVVLTQALVKDAVEFDGNPKTREGLLLQTVDIPYYEGAKLQHTELAWLIAVTLNSDGTLQENLRHTQVIASTYGRHTNELFTDLRLTQEHGRTALQYRMYDPASQHFTIRKSVAVKAKQANTDPQLSQNLVVSATNFVETLQTQHNLTETLWLMNESIFKSAFADLKRSMQSLWLGAFSLIYPSLHHVKQQTSNQKPDPLMAVLKQAEPYIKFSSVDTQQLQRIKTEMEQMATAHFKAMPSELATYMRENNPDKRAQLYDNFLNYLGDLWENKLKTHVTKLNTIVKKYSYTNFATERLAARWQITPKQFNVRIAKILSDKKMQAQVQHYVRWLEQVRHQVDPNNKKPLQMSDVEYLQQKGMELETGSAEEPRISLDQTYALLREVAKNELGIDLTQAPFNNIIFDIAPRSGKVPAPGAHTSVDAQHSYLTVNANHPAGLTLKEIRIAFHELVHAIHSQLASVKAEGHLSIKDLSGVPVDIREGLAKAYEVFFFGEKGIAYLKKYGFPQKYLEFIKQHAYDRFVWATLRDVLKSKAELKIYQEANLPFKARVHFWKAEVKKYLKVETTASAFGEYLVERFLVVPDQMLTFGAYSLGWYLFDPILQQQGPLVLFNKVKPQLEQGALLNRKQLDPLLQ